MLLLRCGFSRDKCYYTVKCPTKILLVIIICMDTPSWCPFVTHGIYVHTGGISCGDPRVTNEVLDSDKSMVAHVGVRVCHEFHRPCFRT